jgi:hypothetical protein
MRPHVLSKQGDFAMNISYKSFIVFLFATVCLTLSSSTMEAKSTYFNFDFSVNNQGWQGDFSDYPIGEEAFYELSWGWTTLPAALSFDGHILTQGMVLLGNNHSDDLFMFIKRQIEGLKPNTFYDLTFGVLIENNIPPGIIGIGGSPGEGVYFKVGAATIEPQKVDVNGIYRMNVDKGEQSQGGKNAIVVGDLANPLVNPLNPQFEPKEFTNEGNPLRIKTDSKGRLWLFVGTDSGFEGSTLYYIAHIAVRAQRAKQAHHNIQCR